MLRRLVVISCYYFSNGLVWNADTHERLHSG